MKKNLLSIMLLVSTFMTFTACGGGKEDGVAFNPRKNSSEAELSDAERERLIEEKKAAYNNSSSSDAVASILDFEGKVKLTVLVPEQAGVSEPQYQQIQSKLIQMATTNGIGGLGGNPRFVLAPMVTLLQKDVTSTAPAKHMLKYDVTFYIADIVSGTVFSSYNTQFTGVGESDQLAFMAAFNSINPKDNKIQQFIKEGQDKILAYYKANGGKFIQEAEMLAAQHKYEQALAILASIPAEVDPHYETAVKKSVPIFNKYLEENGETTLAMMKAALGSQTEGFNEEAMNYYKMIPAGSKAKKEADKAYDEYKKGLDAQQQRKWAQEEKQWQVEMNMKMKQQDADNAFRAQEAELKARVEMSGNQCLLDKYKKDAAYDRLPWIRKVFYLGDLDPFDGYRKDKDC